MSTKGVGPPKKTWDDLFQSGHLYSQACHILCAHEIRRNQIKLCQGIRLPHLSTKRFTRKEAMHVYASLQLVECGHNCRDLRPQNGELPDVKIAVFAHSHFSFEWTPLALGYQMSQKQ